MRNTFVNTLTEQARVDERIFLITCDMGYSVFEKFEEEFPDRYLNVGISEQNAVGVASGLALSGKIVYVYSIIPFVTMRCFEQIRVDVAYMNTNVRLVGVGAGLSYGPAGATHHAIEDIAIMRALPNMVVCCPGDPHEAKELIKRSFDHIGPMYIRLGKNGERIINNTEKHINIGEIIQLSEGDDLVIISTSNMLEYAFESTMKYKDEGYHITLLSVPTIKPIDTEVIKKFLLNQTPVVTIEEHNIIGGLGSTIAEIIAESGLAIKFKRIAIPDTYSHYVGSHHFLRNKFGLESLNVDFIKQMI